ncbi:unnamed protein product [Fusarium graminearum]|nr:unnamed protein product [Fusarium graminearum]
MKQSIFYRKVVKIITGSGIDGNVMLLCYHTNYQHLSGVLMGRALTQKDGTPLPRSMRRILTNSGYLPRVSPLLLLQQLRPSRFSCLNETWQTAVMQYALSITAVQRAKRLIKFQSSPADILRELQNPGHDTWEAENHPEWLLLE